VRRSWCAGVAGGLTLLFSVAASSQSSSERIVSIALGYSHTCVLLGSGDVRCWGQDQAVAGLKLDENIPQSAAMRLAALGYDVDTVLDERLGGRSDEDVWAAAQAEGRLLVTHDLDFADARKFEPGKHAGNSEAAANTRR
jgi:Domain of unknown function (DUF5615)/Regulator of chromosome condensation (RCC1) repeat